MSKHRCRKSDWIEIDILLLRDMRVAAMTKHMKVTGMGLHSAKRAIAQECRRLSRRGLVKDVKIDRAHFMYTVTFKGLKWADAHQPGFLAERVLEDL